MEPQWSVQCARASQGRRYRRFAAKVSRCSCLGKVVIGRNGSAPAAHPAAEIDISAAIHRRTRGRTAGSGGACWCVGLCVCDGGEATRETVLWGAHPAAARRQTGRPSPARPRYPPTPSPGTRPSRPWPLRFSRRRRRRRAYRWRRSLGVPRVVDSLTHTAALRPASVAGPCGATINSIVHGAAGAGAIRIV